MRSLWNWLFPARPRAVEIDLGWRVEHATRYPSSQAAGRLAIGSLYEARLDAALRTIEQFRGPSPKSKAEVGLYDTAVAFLTMHLATRST